MRRALLALALVAAGCSFYSPTIADCAVHCDEAGKCPQGFTCGEGWCRPSGATGHCDCKAGDQRNCGGDAGECFPGVENCTSEGRWSGLCVGEGKPTRELCDGKDNDCNGLVDDNPTDLSACELTQGVCASAKHRCVDGAQAPCVASDYDAGYEPVEQSCDGLDNDCDGLADVTALQPLLDAGSVHLWALQQVGNAWAIAWTRTGPDAGTEEVVVSKYGPTFQPLGAPLVLASGAPALGLAAVAVGPELYVGWVDDAVQLVKVTSAWTVQPYPKVADAGYFAGLNLGASAWNSGTAAMTWLRGAPNPFDGGTFRTPLLARWDTDSGVLLGVQALDKADRGLPVIDVYSVNVSRDAVYTLWQGYEADGGGGHFTQLMNTATGDFLNQDAYYFGGNTTVMFTTADGGLTTEYTYLPSSWCGIYVNPNLADPADIELTIASDYQSAYTFTGSDMTIDRANQVVDIVYNDTLNKNLWMASMGAGAGSLFQPVKALPRPLGFGVPRLAQPAAGNMLGLVTESAGGLSAARVCSLRQ